MGLKQWWRQHGAQPPPPKPKDGGKLVPDSLQEYIAKMYSKRPDYRYLYSMNELRMDALRQAHPRHTIRVQNDSVIQCSCGDYFLREKYPGHIAEHV